MLREAPLLVNQGKIDKIDSIILSMLLKDARTSFADLGRKCGVNPNVIRTHYSRLKQEGVITGEITELNPEYFGYKYSTMIRLKVEPNKIDKAISRLENFPLISRMEVGIGGNNVLCFIWGRDLKDLNRIIERLGEIDGIKSVQSNVVILSEIRECPENLQIRKRRDQ